MIGSLIKALDESLSRGLSRLPRTKVPARFLCLGPDLARPSQKEIHCRQVYHVQGYLAHNKLLTPLGLPYGPRHSPTVES